MLESKSLAQLGAEVGSFVPVLAQLLEGPFPSDSLFLRQHLSSFGYFSLFFCPFSVLSPSFCPRGVRWCLSLSILVFLFRFAVLPQFSFLLGISLFLPSFLLPSPTFLSESQTLPLPETPSSLLCHHPQLGGRKKSSRCSLAEVAELLRETEGTKGPTTGGGGTRREEDGLLWDL